MELNEVTRKLPPHLLQFVVDQPYSSYTAVDQAVWRYVMRQNYYHLQKVAHESYVEGLRKTGVEIENIPTMYGMNRILKEIGWAAVAVDGFIPPGAFMEFTKYNVLVIAADIRTLEHIEYTPAPDIIHESAGHAPIIAEPEFAAYLKFIGEVGSKAFTSKKDYELYEAIRHLSIIKEDPNTKEKDVAESEAEIERIQLNMGEPSEMARIRNLHWWTVEYGLIGSVDNFKLYGAGLLSSIGESKSCLDNRVKKLPYTIEAANCNYDITKPQPQLFVTPDFKHLSQVLNQFIDTMAWKNGGLDGLKKAVASEQIATIVYSSGLQVSGLFTEVLSDNKGNPIFFKTTGPTALAFKDLELEGFGKKKFPKGFSSPIGKVQGMNTPLENLRDSELKAFGIEVGEKSTINFEMGITVSGTIDSIIRSSKGKILVIGFEEAVIKHNSQILEESSSYFMVVGEKIISAYSGPADIEAFQPTVLVPKEKTHKVTYNEEAMRLQELYKRVREIRETKNDFRRLPEIWKTIEKEYSNDWLLPLEILELFEKNSIYPLLREDVHLYLRNLSKSHPPFAKLIVDGLELIKK